SVGDGGWAMFPRSASRFLLHMTIAAARTANRRAAASIFIGETCHKPDYQGTHEHRGGVQGKGWPVAPSGELGPCRRRASSLLTRTATKASVRSCIERQCAALVCRSSPS